MNSVADDWFPKHRINVDEYYRMAEVGLLAHDARVELIDGEVMDMVPIGSRHAAVVDALNRQLSNVVGSQALVTVQRPVRLNYRSEPQPDIALVKPRADFYSSAHPSPSDVLLIIEVSDTTLRYDRDVKLPLYASHAIPEVWLIDLKGKQLQRSRQPVNQLYSATESFTAGMLEASLLPGCAIDLTVVLGLLA
jgi:Uma2 family endonuclease